MSSKQLYIPSIAALQRSVSWNVFLYSPRIFVEASCICWRKGPGYWYDPTWNIGYFVAWYPQIKTAFHCPASCHPYRVRLWSLLSPDISPFDYWVYSAALTLFLATTDAVSTTTSISYSINLTCFRLQTIVSTSLPTISSELKASPNQYTWVGVSYMLTQTAFQPLYGRVSDLVGRKV